MPISSTSYDRVIREYGSWEEFFREVSALPDSAPTGTPAKGSVFERLTQLYLKTHPEYQTFEERPEMNERAGEEMGGRSRG